MSRTVLLTTAALAVLLVSLVALMVVVLVPEEAEASFPGKNGKIAFYGYQDGDADIYKINSDGTGLKQLTNNTVADYEPSWSPDGSKVAFW